MDNGLYNIDKPDDYFNTKLHTGDGGGSGSSTELHQTQMEVLHQQYQLIQQVDLVLCLIQEQEV
jgi:hypothetical protein